MVPPVPLPPPPRPTCQPTHPCAASRALFSHLVDYAGMFPPAALNPATALNNYIRYQNDSNSWILSSFLATAAQIRALRVELSGVKIDRLPVSLIASSRAPDLSGVVADLKALAAGTSLVGIEGSLAPDTAIGTQIEAYERVLDEVAKSSSDVRPTLFLEAPHGDDWERTCIEMLSYSVRAASIQGSRIGLKLRCGGTPDLIPSTRRIVFALRETAAHQIPIKFTAGLHKPFRTTSPNQPEHTIAHGYFNVFFTALLSHRAEIPPSELERLLQDTGSLNPVFSDGGIEWLGFSLRTEDISHLRAKLVTSFGSCSFDEPTHEAALRGWLP